MKLLAEMQNILPENKDMKNNSNIRFLHPNEHLETREEVVYRRNGKTVDRIIEIDVITGLRIRTTYYDYFDSNKVRSIDEYDKQTGNKIRTINYVLYKSIDEFDSETGKKTRTINFSVKDESKISSVQEYDIETGKIVTVSIFKRDGKTVSIVKKVDPVTEKVTNLVNQTDYTPIIEANFPTRNYNNIKVQSRKGKDDIATLIDNLYTYNKGFEDI